MKKQYTSPEAVIVKMEFQSFLAGSPEFGYKDSNIDNEADVWSNLRLDFEDLWYAE